MPCDLVLAGRGFHLVESVEISCPSKTYQHSRHVVNCRHWAQQANGSCENLWWEGDCAGGDPMLKDRSWLFEVW